MSSPLRSRRLWQPAVVSGHQPIRAPAKTMNARPHWLLFSSNNSSKKLDRNLRQFLIFIFTFFKGWWDCLLGNDWQQSANSKWLRPKQQFGCQRITQQIPIIPVRIFQFYLPNSFRHFDASFGNNPMDSMNMMPYSASHDNFQHWRPAEDGRRHNIPNCYDQR